MIHASGGNATAEASPHIQIEISPQISMMQGNLRELKEQLPEGEESTEVKDAIESLEKLEQKPSKEEMSKSAEMSKLKRFLTELGDEDSPLGKKVKGIKKGVSIAQDIGGYYNDVAQWCGLPQVPTPFLKKD